MEFSHRQKLDSCCSNPAGHHKLLAITWKLSTDGDRKSATQMMCQYCAAVFNTTDIMDLHQKRCSRTCEVSLSSDSPASL